MIKKSRSSTSTSSSSFASAIAVIAVAAVIATFFAQIPVFGAAYTPESLCEDVGKIIYETVKSPSVGSVGGEWAILGLARSDSDIPKEYFENYYKNVQACVKSKNGVLHEKKLTEHSRVIIALSAIGKDARNVAGFNLLTPLGDYEKTVKQGVNGAIWALLALDSANFEVPENTEAKVRATRQMYVDHILEKQNSDGGWSLSSSSSSSSSASLGSDVDLTCMALQALAKYRGDGNSNVDKAISLALKFLSEAQNSSGAVGASAESCAQALVALCELGISADDPSFVKNGNTLFDALCTYYVNGKGFRHNFLESDVNAMATEQCFYALAALVRARASKDSLYRINYSPPPQNTLISAKHKDVKVPEITSYGKTFSDIAFHKNRAAIEALAKRGILNGKTDSLFKPSDNMTRAEFAAVFSRGLGLPQKSFSPFADVKRTDWFYSSVSTAYFYGIVNGVSATEFSPGAPVTRCEAAVMALRAANLCGVDGKITQSQISSVLSDYSDTSSIPQWARESLAFCLSKGIIVGENGKINPSQAVNRGEIAQLIYEILNLAKLV